MTRIEEMSSRASTSKVKLFAEMKAALTAHLRAEEKIFYNAMKPDKNAHDAALEGYEEHHVADLPMREISRLSPSDEKWTAKFAVLKENVAHQVEEEEGEIWAKAPEDLRRSEGRGTGRGVPLRKGEAAGQSWIIDRASGQARPGDGSTRHCKTISSNVFGKASL